MRLILYFRGVNEFPFSVETSECFLPVNGCSEFRVFLVTVTVRFDRYKPNEIRINRAVKNGFRK